MHLFCYGSLELPSIQRILFGRYYIGHPKILSGFTLYKRKASNDYYIAEVDFGFVKGSIIEIDDCYKREVDAYLSHLRCSQLYDGIFVYCGNIEDGDTVVLVDEQSKIKYDVTALEERANNRHDNLGYTLPYIVDKPKVTFSELARNMKHTLKANTKRIEVIENATDDTYYLSSK